MADSQEPALVGRLLQIQTESLQGEVKQQWFGDAYSFLRRTEGHWWCLYGDVTAGLSGDTNSVK